jgi:hypothetical protein
MANQALSSQLGTKPSGFEISMAIIGSNNNPCSWTRQSRRLQKKSTVRGHPVDETESYLDVLPTVSFVAVEAAGAWAAEKTEADREAEVEADDQPWSQWRKQAADMESRPQRPDQLRPFGSLSGARIASTGPSKICGNDLNARLWLSVFCGDEWWPDQ